MRTKKGTKNKVVAKNYSPDLGENKVCKGKSAERDSKGSSYPKSAVLGNGAQGVSLAEYPLVKKMLEDVISMRDDRNFEDESRLVGKRIRCLKEMAGSPLLSVKEREGSTTCSSVSTTSSSGDERVIMTMMSHFLARNQFCYRRTNRYL